MLELVALGAGTAMKPFIRKAAPWLRHRAENIAAGLLAAMFIAFVVQIVFRYFFNFPIGWTSELSVIAWLWLVLWGAAFVVKEGEEIRFDLIYGAVGRRTRLVLGTITGASIVALYAASLPATVKYVGFMKVEHSSYLKIRLDYLYSIYVIFAVAVIVRYLWILSHVLRGKEPEALDSTTGSSDL
jgi:TRAP-type C4-dicarboxylate transport system permease small subunit